MAFIPKRKKKIDFLLETKDYRRFHLYIYLFSVVIIIFIYFFMLYFFSSKNIYVTGFISVVLGIFLVLKRDFLVKKLGESLFENKLKKRKIENKVGLKKTIRTISPKTKRNINLSIGGSDTLKDRFNNLKSKFSFNKKKKKDYIEIK